MGWLLFGVVVTVMLYCCVAMVVVRHMCAAVVVGGVVISGVVIVVVAAAAVTVMCMAVMSLWLSPSNCLLRWRLLLVAGSAVAVVPYQNMCVVVGVVGVVMWLGPTKFVVGVVGVVGVGRLLL